MIDYRNRETEIFLLKKVTRILFVLLAGLILLTKDQTVIRQRYFSPASFISLFLWNYETITSSINLDHLVPYIQGRIQDFFFRRGFFKRIFFRRRFYKKKKIKNRIKNLLMFIFVSFLTSGTNISGFKPPTFP